VRGPVSSVSKDSECVVLLTSEIKYFEFSPASGFTRLLLLKEDLLAILSTGYCPGGAEGDISIQLFNLSISLTNSSCLLLIISCNIFTHVIVLYTWPTH